MFRNQNENDYGRIKPDQKRQSRADYPGVPPWIAHLDS